MNNDLRCILEFLKEKRGFDFSGYRSSMVKRRIDKRLFATECKDYKQYLHYVQEQADELDKLVDVLTINVSSFFRDTLIFEYIAHKILPAIVFEKIETHDHSLKKGSSPLLTYSH